MSHWVLNCIGMIESILATPLSSSLYPPFRSLLSSLSLSLSPSLSPSQLPAEKNVLVISVLTLRRSCIHLCIHVVG